MALSREMLYRWLCILTLVAAIGFVFSLPAKALDPRIVERLPMGYTEESDVKVFEGAFDKDAYHTALPPEDNSGSQDSKDKGSPDADDENASESIPEESLPEVLDSGQVLDSGIDPQQKMYDDISGIRQGIDIIVYFVIPMIVGAGLLCKFCTWFYGTFIESAWNK